MESIIHALHLNFKVMFTQLVGFVLLFWLLKKFLFGPVGEMINNRNKEIQAEYDKNEKGRKEIESAKEDYQKKLSELKMEGERIVSEARIRAEGEKERIIAKAKTEAEAIMQKAREKVAEEQKRVMDQIQARITEVSVSIASKLISRSISKDDHKQFIDEYLTQMEGVYGNN